ncbi:hypothetical protein Q8F55_007441 [Vanrija albida]|uniref:Uncharacterized protein n=1 Tax=Vanrija albida TaxID=181172 RepID=A0ABR3PUI5_9TREE
MPPSRQSLPRVAKAKSPVALPMSRPQDRATASSTPGPSTAGPSNPRRSTAGPSTKPAPPSPSPPPNTGYMFAHYPVGQQLTTEEMAQLGYTNETDRYTKKGKVGVVRRVRKYIAPPHAACKRCRNRPGPCWVEVLEVAAPGGYFRNLTCHFCSQNGACETGTNNKHFFLAFPDSDTMYFVHRQDFEVYRTQHLDELRRVNIVQLGEGPPEHKSRAKSPSERKSKKKGKGKAKATSSDSDLESEEGGDSAPHSWGAGDDEGSVNGHLPAEETSEDRASPEGAFSNGDGAADPDHVEYGSDEEGGSEHGDGQEDGSGRSRDGSDEYDTAAGSTAGPIDLDSSSDESTEYGGDPQLELAALKAQKARWKEERREWGVFDVSMRAENHDLRTRLERAEAANRKLLQRVKAAETTTEKLALRVNELSEQLYPARGFD